MRQSQTALKMEINTICYLESIGINHKLLNIDLIKMDVSINSFKTKQKKELCVLALNFLLKKKGSPARFTVRKFEKLLEAAEHDIMNHVNI